MWKSEARLNCCSLAVIIAQRQGRWRRRALSPTGRLTERTAELTLGASCGICPRCWTQAAAAQGDHGCAEQSCTFIGKKNKNQNKIKNRFNWNGSVSLWHLMWTLAFSILIKQLSKSYTEAPWIMNSVLQPRFICIVILTISREC